MKSEIWKYEDTDKDEVRKIAISTATGYPRTDLQLVGDLLTDFYITYEPEHLLVAERKGRVIGYLSGCFDSARCRWVKTFRVIPKAIFKAFFRGEIGWREVRYMSSLAYVAMHGGTRNNPPDGYPAHFHINVAEGARGLGIGSKLVEKFLTMLKEADVSGVHVRVRQNDKRASDFFKKFGFSREYGYPTLLADGKEFRTSRSIIYTKDL